MEPLWNLLLIAAISAVIALVISTLAARVRFSAPRGLRWALDILFLLPMAIPEILSFCAPFLTHGIAGCSPKAPTTMIVATAAIWALPILYLCAVIGFRKVARETIDAARLQGLGRCGIFWRVFFPPAWPWLAAGLGIALIRLGLLGALLALG